MLRTQSYNEVGTKMLDESLETEVERRTQGRRDL